MITKTYYLEAIGKTYVKIGRAKWKFFTFVDVENIEMNYLKITITMNKQDEKAIDTMMND